MPGETPATETELTAADLVWLDERLQEYRELLYLREIIEESWTSARRRINKHSEG